MSLRFLRYDTHSITLANTTFNLSWFFLAEVPLKIWSQSLGYLNLSCAGQTTNYQWKFHCHHQVAEQFVAWQRVIACYPVKIYAYKKVFFPYRRNRSNWFLIKVWKWSKAGRIINPWQLNCLCNDNRC